LTAPLKLAFTNGRHIKISALIGGGEKVAALDENTKNFLLSKAV
jgi:hypothetical protein